ncbi:cyclopropane-fatty-acyl-phospholipid synthase [Hyaloscypha variabilis F]|uniref:sphingolipid C(9)-methyltransferase n=1 Tax=Hyaloscypha variabilis (strain UAMH 11265 / GT02V1 / F) TaxID=1149755 RepID=A0A2J6RH47_HYAVF|nr:cyclopropane-fatty-acyl-phospholipid synthase [Hyaloscypha variabilis F]
MTTKVDCVTAPETEIEFITTPEPASQTFKTNKDCGVNIISSPSIKDGILPADGPGAEGFSNLALLALFISVPALLSYLLSLTWLITAALAVLTFFPLLASFWYLSSCLTPRKNEKVKLPGRPIESYLNFLKASDRHKYKGMNKIPIDTFQTLYFNGDVEFKGDCLEVLEYRHDWASFHFTLNIFKFFLFSFIPEVILHTRSQDEEQVRNHYDRGDDFYSFFLGPRMIYTTGIVSNPSIHETLEQLQDNKLSIVCRKLGLRPGEKLLDIGCGWGTLARFASKEYNAHVTGITLGKNQTAWGNRGLLADGIPSTQSQILCLDYRDIPQATYDKITCLEMAEHVGIRHFSSFLNQVYNLLDDDGVFIIQLSGLRKSWQYEDLIWGLFMNRYIFPGADASTPLGFYISSAESAGFEVKGLDTIGIHYSATMWRWYRNWVGNKEKVLAKYGGRWYRIWEYFLASSTIASRQGTATCYQIALVKNLNSTQRTGGIGTQFALSGALAAKDLKE